MTQQENPVWLPSNKLDEVDPREIQSDSSGSVGNMQAGKECRRCVKDWLKIYQFSLNTNNVREILAQII
jgi:hypothetical protein